jgi:ribosomal protein S18 acetylase RimI-like enzyme
MCAETDGGIHPVEAGDWTRLRELRLAALLDAPDAFGGTYDDEAARDETAWRWWIGGEEGRSTGRTFVEEREGALTGMATGMVFAERPATAHLFGMWVRPQDRGRGVGAALVDEVVGWAAARDAERIELRVADGNDAATRLYERAGFVLRPEDRSPLREGFDVVTIGMELLLAPD